MLEKKGTNWPFQFEDRPVEGGGCIGQSGTINDHLSQEVQLVLKTMQFHIAITVIL